MAAYTPSPLLLHPPASLQGLGQSHELGTALLWWQACFTLGACSAFMDAPGILPGNAAHPYCTPPPCSPRAVTHLFQEANPIHQPDRWAPFYRGRSSLRSRRPTFPPACRRAPAAGGLPEYDVCSQGEFRDKKPGRCEFKPVPHQ